MRYVMVLLVAVLACSESTGAGFDVSATLSRQTGGCSNCCAWWWRATATDTNHVVTYTVSVGPATRNDTFQQSVVVSVPELGTVLGPGRYEYRWHVDAYNLTKGYSDFDRSFSDSVSCP